MTNRRTFLGATLAASAAGGIRLMAAGEVPDDTVAFFARTRSANPSAGGLFGGGGDALGEPERVEPGSVTVGHFHGLVHDGEGRVSYLYEAELADRRTGYVQLSEAASGASI